MPPSLFLRELLNTASTSSWSGEGGKGEATTFFNLWRRVLLASYSYHLTQTERDESSRKRFYAIPMSLIIEAQKYAVSIDETCIQALKHKIQEKKRVVVCRDISQGETRITTPMTLITTQFSSQITLR